MDLVISPTTVALNPQLGTAVPALKAGDVIEAQVLALLGDGRARLALANTILEVQTQVALTPGTTVKLAVKNTPDGIRLSIVGNPVATPAATQAAPAVAASASAVPNTPASPAPATVAPAAALPTEQAATVVQVTTQGTATSAAAAATTAPPAVSTAPAPPLASEPAAAAAALSTAIQTSAARQNGLAPLFADANVAVTVAALPEPVRRAAAQLLALRPPLETLSADGLKQAVTRSGLFLEARVSAALVGEDAPAAGSPTRAATAPAPSFSAANSSAPGASLPTASDDLKAALIVLRNTLKTWLAADAPEASAFKIGRILEAIQNPPIAGAAPSSAARLVAPQAEGAPPDEPRAPAVPAPPPPPYRGAPPAPQAVSAPSIAPEMAPRDIGKVLLSETDSAIARQTLLQAASLSNDPGPAARNDVSGPRWHFEVPFAIPQGTAVAQFEVARDGRNAPAEGSKPVWRARFSLDIEPIGPVHAQVALIGSRTAVTLWAERPETSAELRDHAGELAEALRGAELDPGDVLVRYGAPPRPREAAAATSGRFLDRAS